MMSSDEAAKIASVLCQLDGATAESVLAELDQGIQRLVRQFMETAPSSLVLDEGTSYSTASLVEMLESAVSRPSAPLAACAQPESNSLESSSDADLLTLLRNEYPQVSAVCMAGLDPGRAARLLAQLEERIRVDVITRLRDLAGLESKLMEEVHEEACSYQTQPDAPRGAARARAIVDCIPSELRQELWTSLAPGSPAAQKTGTVEDLSADFIRQLENDASLASLEFNRLCEQWSALEAIVECVPVTVLYNACQGLEPKPRQSLYGRLPDATQLQIRSEALSRLPLTLDQIHAAQVQILRAAVEADSYQFSVWQRKKHISVAA